MAPTVYLHDGSFEGLLTAVAAAVKAKGSVQAVYSRAQYLPALFDKTVEIQNDTAQAERLLQYLQNLSPLARQLAVNGFLSEDRRIGCYLCEFVSLSLTCGAEALDLHNNDAVRALHSLCRKVSFEAHRLNGLIRFRILADGLQYAPFSADHNVIGYCADHFRHRLIGRRWILHDVGRDVALYWDTETLQTVEIDQTVTRHVARFGDLPPGQSTEEEQYFQRLWQSFHTAIANPDRENRLLQLRFMPRRYWRYLIELK